MPKLTHVYHLSTEEYSLGIFTQLELAKRAGKQFARDEWAEFGSKEYYQDGDDCWRCENAPTIWKTSLNEIIW